MLFCNWVKNDCPQHYIEQVNTGVCAPMAHTVSTDSSECACAEKQTAREANWLNWTFCMITCSAAVFLTVRNPPARFNLDAYHKIVPPARYFTPAQFFTNSCWLPAATSPQHVQTRSNPQSCRSSVDIFTCLLEKLCKKTSYSRRKQ